MCDCSQNNKDLLIIAPAFNEEASLRPFFSALKSAFPNTPVLIVNDGSIDHTSALAHSLGAIVLDMPHNVGVGCAMQAGYQYAVAHGFKSVLRLDSDGQHPPSEAYKLLERQKESQADLIVGTRFSSNRVSSHFRSFGARALSRFLSAICRKTISDPTSGFWLVSSPLLEYFALSFPTDYPEPEAIALLHRLGYSYAEIPVTFRTRKHGHSSIDSLDTIYFIIKVCIALVMDRIRDVNRRYERRHLLHAITSYNSSLSSPKNEP